MVFGVGTRVFRFGKGLRFRQPQANPEKRFLFIRREIRQFPQCLANGIAPLAQSAFEPLGVTDAVDEGDFRQWQRLCAGGSVQECVKQPIAIARTQ